MVSVYEKCLDWPWSQVLITYWLYFYVDSYWEHSWAHFIHIPVQIILWCLHGTSNNILTWFIRSGMRRYYILNGQSVQCVWPKRPFLLNILTDTNISEMYSGIAVQQFILIRALNRTVDLNVNQKHFGHMSRRKWQHFPDGGIWIDWATSLPTSRQLWKVLASPDGPCRIQPCGLLSITTQFTACPLVGCCYRHRSVHKLSLC